MFQIPTCGIPNKRHIPDTYSQQQCYNDTVYTSVCIHDTFRCSSVYLLQLLLLAVAILLDNTVELLGFQARHVSLGGHPSRLLGRPGLSQVPVGCCHTLTSCLLLLPPFALVSFGVPTGNPIICSVYLKAVHSFVCLVYLHTIHSFVCSITESSVSP